jgi:hypothetical protein
MQSEKIKIIGRKKGLDKTGDGSEFLIDKSSLAYGNTVYAAAKDSPPSSPASPHSGGRSLAKGGQRSQRKSLD